MISTSSTHPFVTLSNMNQLTHTQLSPFDWGLFILTFIALIALKLMHQQASVDDLQFLLQPVVQALSWSRPDIFTYLPGVGFVNANQSVIIDKGCSGLNFWVIACALGIFTVIPSMLSIRLKILAYLGLWVLAWAVTLLANTARINIALWYQQHSLPQPMMSPAGLHEAIGVVSYVVFLILYYVFLVYSIRQKPSCPA